MRARPQIFHTLLACRHSALNHDSASSQLEVDGVSPHPERVSHPLVLARRHRRRGAHQRRFLALLSGHTSISSVTFMTKTLHTHGVFFPSFILLSKAKSPSGEVSPRTPASLHRLPRRRLRGSLVRLPAPFGNMRLSLCLFVTMSTSYPPSTSGARRRGITAGYEPDLSPPPWA